MAETPKQLYRTFYGDQQCLEHDRLIAECSDLAFQDYGALLFDNCEVARPESIGEDGGEE